jgi:hypothetical protein
MWVYVFNEVSWPTAKKMVMDIQKWKKAIKQRLTARIIKWFTNMNRVYFVQSTDSWHEVKGK